MKPSSILKKVACMIFGASLMYAFMPGARKETVRVERVLVSVPSPPEKRVDAERVRDVFASREEPSATCRYLSRARDTIEVSPTQRIVSARFVDRVLEQQAELMTMARIVPVSHNGKVTGVQLFGVKPGTLTQLLGFQNGDELRDVNGFDIATPESALEAYSRLRTATLISVGIVRKGVSMRLNYDIC